MLLAFDVGNTNVVLGLYEGDKLLDFWRISSTSHRTADEYAMLCFNFFAHKGYEKSQISCAIISSVVPNKTDTLSRMLKKYFDITPLVVGHGLKTGLSMRYENPKELGADRVVNAVSAVHQYGYPLIIIDFGTATTFCVIDQEGNYLGGAITAGIGISMEALFEKTAKLPKVSLQAPKKAIGRTTTTAMQSGLVYGYAGMVDKMVARLAEEISENPKTMKVVATGGRAEEICLHSDFVKVVDPFLTLSGLQLIAQKNRSK